MIYKVTFAKEWTEYGEAEIDAESEDEAREIAEEMLNSNLDSIEWQSSNMDPGDQRIESIESEAESDRKPN